jgi:2'-hydroxyisoflavone reductase
MRILILGGTRFVGRHLVEALLERGHEITLFNRGSSNPDLFPTAQTRIGDRDKGFEALAEGEWDLVVDTCAYVPRQVQTAAAALASRVPRIVFISTISVYDQPMAARPDENQKLQVLEDPNTEEIKAYYGALKVACEEEVLKAWPEDKAWLVRPGIIVGPHDPTDRFTYWVTKMMSGKPFVGPRDLKQPVQALDVRDLAEFIALGIEKGVSGATNVVGSDQTYESLFALGEDVQPVQKDLEEGQSLPMILEPENYPFFNINADKARSLGFKNRPLLETVSATWEWYLEQGSPALKVGLSPEEEAKLLGQ